MEWENVPEAPEMGNDVVGVRERRRNEEEERDGEKEKEREKEADCNRDFECHNPDKPLLIPTEL